MASPATPKASPEKKSTADTTEFLLTAIATLDAAPVFDWQVVADKLGLPTKGAA